MQFHPSEPQSTSCSDPLASHIARSPCPNLDPGSACSAQYVRTRIRPSADFGPNLSELGPRIPGQKEGS